MIASIDFPLHQIQQHYILSLVRRQQLQIFLLTKCPQRLKMYVEPWHGVWSCRVAAAAAQQSAVTALQTRFAIIGIRNTFIAVMTNIHFYLSFSSRTFNILGKTRDKLFDSYTLCNTKITICYTNNRPMKILHFQNIILKSACYMLILASTDLL